MILAMNGLGDLIKIPFGYLLDWLYQFTTNYGLSLIIFAIIVKLVLLPASIKSKKSSMKMSRLSPRVQAIQEKYAGDQQKQNEAVQALYREEGVSMGGGCRWSVLPLFILFPLYAVVRQPITYMLHETVEVAAQVVAVIKDAVPAAFGKNEFYNEMIAASRIPEFAEELKGIVANPRTLEGLNFNFLGINLGLQPNWKIWTWETYDWSTIGLFLLPLASTGVQFLSMFVAQKQNNSVVTNEKGLQDEEMAKKSQANQSTQTMLYMMPLMTLWIGFTVPGALSIYWLIQGVIATVQDSILTKHFRKIYDEEDAIRQARAAEEETLLAEKERIRAERALPTPTALPATPARRSCSRSSSVSRRLQRPLLRRNTKLRRVS